MNEINVGANAPGMHPGARGRWAAAALALLFSVVLAFVPGCGGGVGTGGTGSFSSGSVMGLGSIVVNWVRFNDTNAQVVDDEGTAASKTELAEGVVVDVYSDAISGAADALTATASKISINRFLRGPVTALFSGDSSTGVGSFSAMGFTVNLSSATFYGPGLTKGLPSLSLSDTVVVYGFFDPQSQRVRATRVELSSGGLPWTLRAPVTLDGTAVFTVGSQRFLFAAGDAPTGLVSGSELRVRVGAFDGSRNAWPVQSFRTLQRQLEDDHEAKVKGLISSVLSVSQGGVYRVLVNGIRIDVASALVSPPSLIVPGARVEAEGGLVGGVLVAKSFSIDSESDDDESFQYTGTIVSLTPASSTFVIRAAGKDRLVFYGSPSLEVRLPIRLQTLAVNQVVEVRGQMRNDRIEATRIKQGELRGD